MVFAAGFGTRMRPLTEHCAKPALPVCNQPLIGYALATLARAGICEICINTHHRPEDVRHAADALSQRLGVDLFLLHEEPSILGTGGGLYNAREFLEGGGDSFVVINGDTLIEIDLVPVLARHAQTDGMATMVLRQDERAEEFGALGYDAAGRIWDFVGRAPVPESVGPLEHALFTGVHVLRREALDRLPPGFSGLGQSFYPEALRDELPVHAYLHEGYWADLGTPARYLQTQFDLLAGRAPGLALDPFEGLDLAVDPETEDDDVGLWLAPTAEVDDEAGVAPPVLFGDGTAVAADAQIGPDVVLGVRTRVEAEASLERCVIWDGTVVKAGDYTDAILTPHLIHRVHKGTT